MRPEPLERKRDQEEMLWKRQAKRKLGTEQQSSQVHKAQCYSSSSFLIRRVFIEPIQRAGLCLGTGDSTLNLLPPSTRESSLQQKGYRAPTVNQTGTLTPDQMKYLAHIKDKKVLASPHSPASQSSYYYSYLRGKDALLKRRVARTVRLFSF